MDANKHYIHLLGREFSMNIQESFILECGPHLLSEMTFC